MWDGIIIGGGLAGLIAGIRAVERGKNVLIVSEGTSSLTYSSGALDIGAIDLLKRNEKHPYTLLSERKIHDGLNYFQSLFPEYQLNLEKPSLVLTPLGTGRTAGLVPEGLIAEPLKHVRQILLMAPQGMKDFFAAVVKANLEREFPQSNIEIFPFQVGAFDSWHRAGKAVNGMEYARFWRTEEGRAELERILYKRIEERQENKSHVEGEEGARVQRSGADTGEAESLAVVFPGLTRVFCPPLQRILSQFPHPVIEMTDLSPAFGGHILYEALKRKFKELGGEILIGSGVEKADIEGKRCRQVYVRSKGRDTVLKAQEFVLATGGLFGGGVEATPEGAKEKVFGIPLFLPSEWTEEQFLREQPYARLGIEVDEALHPIDPQNEEVFLENVRVVGRMLSHWDPWSEFCGGGVSLTSGWLAGQLL